MPNLLTIAALAAAVLGLVVVILLGVLLSRRAADPWPMMRDLAQQFADAMQKLDRSIAHEVADQGRAQRVELNDAVGRMAGSLQQQMATLASVQNNQIDHFAMQLNRLTDTNESRLAELRATLDERLQALQQDNAQRLEQMRQTVDEKLQSTLEQRLGESFRLVSERLEQVHRGLGEMQGLAADVGDLKRVLTNVKTRGTWGEVQLAALLEQMLVPGQFARNVVTVPGSSERVEFAIRLPGLRDDQPVWLPIDAKFPREDYERLLAAQDAADPVGAEAALRQLGVRLRDEARTIRQKYLAPPQTTDFAILFLPTEGLYAEAVRRPGLVDTLQREHRVVIAGPTTLAAILSSLQMGFRTLAVEKRSSEVWQLLGAVKTEFGKFGDILARTREQLERATNTLGSAATRTRVIERRLRSVESLPDADSRRWLSGIGDDALAPAEPPLEQPPPS